MVLVSKKQETSKGCAGRRRNSSYFPNWAVTDSCPLKTWTTIITSKRGTWLPSFSVFKVGPRTLGVCFQSTAHDGRLHKSGLSEKGPMSEFVRCRERAAEWPCSNTTNLVTSLELQRLIDTLSTIGSNGSLFDYWLVSLNIFLKKKTLKKMWLFSGFSLLHAKTRHLWALSWVLGNTDWRFSPLSDIL